MKYLGNTKKYKRDKRKVRKKEKGRYLRIVLVIVIAGLIFVGCADKTQLAYQLIEMCKENFFKSIKFATDVRGYPMGIYMRVYLNRWDFKRGRIFMQVKYVPVANNWVGNIRDDSKNYLLVVNRIKSEK